MKSVGSKKPVFWLAAIACIASFGVSSESYAWELICRGGGNTKVNYFNSGSTSGVVMEYSKGTAPAGNGLQPGQCAWRDRGIWSSEPSSICLTRSGSNPLPYISINISRSNVHATTTDLAADTIRAMFRLIHDSYFYYSFDVNNNGQGCMVPTR